MGPTPKPNLCLLHTCIGEFGVCRFVRSAAARIVNIWGREQPTPPLARALHFHLRITIYRDVVMFHGILSHFSCCAPKDTSVFKVGMRLKELS
jgi:hypothetical protein